MNKSSLKQFSFYFILICFPFITLFIVELGLRVSSFGNEYPLFIRVENTDNAISLLQPNPKVINRYFSNENLAPKVSPDTVYFKKDKPENSYRIFIQGGSTAAGFPYGRWGSLQGMLEQRFKRLYPDKEIEIINTAMAAVNSYTLLDFVDEIIEQQPDLILIYAGHNEYLGVMGVGSSFAAKGGRLATLAHLKMKNLRLYQLMQSLYFKFFPAIKIAQSNKTLMAQVAKEKEIPLGSDLYQQGLDQFRDNLSIILKQYHDAGIPVLIGNLIANERGQVPFSSIGHIDWSSYKESLSPDFAKMEIEQLKAKEQNAENYFKVALNHQLLSQQAQAKKAFIQAKDHDLLRFRAPSEFNRIIEELAKQHHATLIDHQARFNAHSKDGIIDNQLILEHLHPTVEGYFLLAESYIEMINNEQLISNTANQYSSEKAKRDIPISINDKLYGQFTIDTLMNDYPFTPLKVHSDKKSNKNVALPPSRKFEKEALIKRINKVGWLTIQQDLLVAYQQRKEMSEAAKIAGAISTAMVTNHRAYFIAGQLYQQLNDWQLARYYHYKAMQLQPEKPEYLLALAQDYYFLQNYQDCLAILEKTQKLAVASSSDTAKILSYIDNVKQALAQQKINEKVHE